MIGGLHRRSVGLAALACVSAYVVAFGTGRAGTPIKSDAFSYYVYLPSWALYHDVSLERVAADCCGGRFPEFTTIIRWPGTGRWVNAHPIGVAVLTCPFFAAAHALTRWTNLSPDGFTFYYQHAVGMAGLCYAIAGLWFLRRLLDRHFSPGVTVATLGALLFGTSLLHYATFDSGWSHAFTFCLVAALLERLDASPRSGVDLMLAGLLGGLIVLVRHTNLVLPLVIVPARIRQPRALALVAGAAAATVLPQLLLYRYATGHLVVSSYGTLGFARPHVWSVLFGVQKGVFFWAPVLLAAVPGFLLLPASLQWVRGAAIAGLGVHVLVIASWWDWQFGASFGHRGFVDVYPLLALPLASSFAWVAGRRYAVRGPVAVAAATACALTFFEMLQYWNGVLPRSDMTWTQYTEVFLRWR